MKLSSMLNLVGSKKSSPKACYVVLWDEPETPKSIIER